MGILRYPLHEMFHLREQRQLNVQLVPIHRSQPVDELSGRYGALFLF